ncbi:hypothetical protein V8E36_006600 [Tilletia maclaganii]
MALTSLPANLDLTPSQFEEYEYFRVYKAICYVLLGSYIWEYILTFRTELDVLTGKRPLRLYMLPYFATRYCCLGTTIPNLMLMHSSVEVSCQAVVSLIILMAATTQILSQVMFSIRALALWSYDRRVGALLAMIWIPHAVISYLVVDGFETKWRPDYFGHGGFCGVGRYSKFGVPSYSLLFATDIVVGTLILVQLFALRKTARSQFTDVLARDLLLFLLCCLVPCLTGLIVVLAKDSIALRSAFYIITTQTHAVFSCRAFINTSKLAEKLPAHLRLRVHNEHLDPDTLRRIAGHLGMQPDMSAINGGPHSSDLSFPKDVERQEKGGGKMSARLASVKTGLKRFRPGPSSHPRSSESRGSRIERGPRHLHLNVRQDFSFCGAEGHSWQPQMSGAGHSPISIETFSTAHRPFSTSASIIEDLRTTSIPSRQRQHPLSQQQQQQQGRKQTTEGGHRVLHTYFPSVSTMSVSKTGGGAESLGGITLDDASPTTKCRSPECDRHTPSLGGGTESTRVSISGSFAATEACQLPCVLNSSSTTTTTTAAGDVVVAATGSPSSEVSTGGQPGGRGTRSGSWSMAAGRPRVSSVSVSSSDERVETMQ